MQHYTKNLPFLGPSGSSATCACCRHRVGQPWKQSLLLLLAVASVVVVRVAGKLNLTVNNNKVDRLRRRRCFIAATRRRRSIGAPCTHASLPCRFPCSWSTKSIVIADVPCRKRMQATTNLFNRSCIHSIARILSSSRLTSKSHVTSRTLPSHPVQMSN